MLRNTFVHLPGVGLHRERELWDRGVLDWEQLLAAPDRGRKLGIWFDSAESLIQRSVEALAGGDPGFFGKLLPSAERWRLFADFADRAVFLDIETTGLSAATDQVTVIGALGGGELAVFVQGVNLDEFPAYIERFPLLISYNGSRFDVPFLRAHFPNARLDQAHIDLRFVLASLGFKEGLKGIEARVGLDRGSSLQGVDGFEAVRLWYRYQRGDQASLEKLILYNLTDVANLVPLAELAFDRKRERLRFPGQAQPPAAGNARRLDHPMIAAWLAGRLGSL